MLTSIQAQMRRLFLFAWVLAAAQADELPKEVIQLAQIKRQAAAELKQLPAFTCLANYARFRAGVPGTPLVVKDALHVDVVYADHRERFGWPGSGKMDSTLSELTGMGLASEGEFLSFANTLFVNNTASARFAGEEEVRGRRVLRYDYSIPAMLSGYKLVFPEGTAVVAIKGAFWADKETLHVVRLRVEADEIPAFLGLTQAVTVIDYARTKLGIHPLTLFPQAASVTIGSRKETLRNEVEYTHCREFLATSRVSFPDAAGTDAADTDAADTDAANVRKTSADKTVPLVLPVDTKLRIRITEPITTDEALGDPVFGEVEGGRYAGASVVGRIRMLQSIDARRSVLGLEMTELVADGGAVGRLFASATRMNPGFAGGILRDREIAVSDKHTTQLPSLPGVVFLLVGAGEKELVPAGTWMEWRVMALK